MTIRWAPMIVVAVLAIVARTVWYTFAPAAPATVGSAATAPAPQPHVFAGGIVEGAGRELALRFEIPGRVKVVHVRQGDTVKAGDVLAELESDVAELNLAEANFRLRIAVAERNQLIADARRFALHQAGAVQQAADGRARQVAGQEPQTGATDSPLSREEQIIADGKIGIAEAAVRRERLLLEKVRLHAPVDGTILRTTFEPGELTGPTDDSAFLSLVNRETLTVRAFVEELDALRIAPGQQATVSAAGTPGQRYAAVVRTCSPDLRPKSHRHLKPGERLDVRVREVIIELDDNADLLIGLPVEVFIEATPRSRTAR